MESWWSITARCEPTGFLLQHLTLVKGKPHSSFDDIKRENIKNVMITQGADADNWYKWQRCITKKPTATREKRQGQVDSEV